MSDDLASVRNRLSAVTAAGRRVFVFTDFDGTLAPLQDDPFAVRLTAALTGTLARLADHPQFELAVVSGRDLADLMPRVGLPAIPYAGNHGLEIRGPGLEFVEPAAAAARPVLAAVAARLADQLGAVPGLWVQDKGLTLCVHTRRVHPDYLPLVAAEVGRLARTAGDAVTVRTGHDTFDLRPRVSWHKGEAVRWLLERVAPDAFPVYLGDDTTDEDAFAALPDGATVFVGPPRPTAARFRLASVDRVGELLHGLVTP